MLASMLVAAVFTTASLDAAVLKTRISAIDKASQGRLGVGVKDLSTGQTWFLRGNEHFPLLSVFKLPLGIAVLYTVDKGKLSLNTKIKITKNDLSTPYSRVNEDFAKRQEYTVGDLLKLAVGESDNSAADILMRKVGGPKRVMTILQGLGIKGVSVDHYEREFQITSAGLPPMRPEWAKEEEIAKAINAVPAAKRRVAFEAYLKDPRDTATPVGMVDLLERLQAGRLLSKTSNQYLFKIMTESTTGLHRLREALPTGASLAHKTGTGREVFGVASGINDVGIVTLPNGHRLIIAVFLAGSKGTYAARDKVIADVGRAVVLSHKSQAPGAH